MAAEEVIRDGKGRLKSEASIRKRGLKATSEST